ncbi:MAG: CDP-glycerol glycerophosphotransferase family protein [Helicobacter sp.]|nr:CDP-glycerol glycerophosphotransferase family protein [Helicobacter sp.]
MNIKEQLEAFINIAAADIKSHLSTTQKNILFISFYPSYRSQYGDLIQELSKHYNVITIVDRILGDDFEKSAHHNVLFPWRIIENGEVFYLNTHIDGIDIIITADQTAYDDGRIDRTFLSQNAKRIYLPHRLTYACGESSKSFDYIIVPSKSAMQSFKKALKDSSIKLLPCGYPQLDKAINQYRYQSSNTITYSPTLRDINPTRNADQNLYAGFDSNIIEWILQNTSYNITYRSHPFNFAGNHRFYQLLKAKWMQNPRIIFDESQNYDFFNTSDFLLTDWSSTSFLFSYTTLRPCIFYMPHPLDSTQYTIKDKTAKNFKQLQAIFKSINFKQEKKFFQHLRETDIYYPKKSSEAILESLEDILKGRL